MPLTNIFGYHDSRDLAAQTLADYTEDRAMRDIQQFAAEYNAKVQELERDLASRGTDVQSQYGTSVGGEMQPYGEVGETEATRGGQPWPVAYPIRAFRSRKMYTEQVLQGLTLDKLQQHILQEAVSNFETRRKMILRALLGSANYTFDDGTTNEDWPRMGLGSLTIRRLANADSSVGEVMVNGSAVSVGTLAHYFGTNNATLAITHFETAYAKLKAVGHARDVVVRIAPGNENAVKALTDFYRLEDARIVDPTKKYSRVTSPRAIGRLHTNNMDAEVIVEDFMPTGYVFMNDRAGGEDDKPVRIRERPEPVYKGWRLVQDETRASYGEASLRNKRWEYIAGAGVRNRVNGVAFQIVASATYTDPVF